MAEIAPFRGIVYNRDKVPDMALVTAPPCGAVPPGEQANYQQSHPCNAMNLDFGPCMPGDYHEYDWHWRAAIDFNRWLCEGYLLRHDRPAVYLQETDFPHPETGIVQTRRGFTCLLKLEDFHPKSFVRPHERTFSSFRAERLSHLEHVQANLSQLFGIFSDEECETDRLLLSGSADPPLFDFTDRIGMTHRLWPIYDRHIIRDLSDLMKKKVVYIADGHHRYLSSLEYRRRREERGVRVGRDSPLNFIMAYLCATSDQGLVILPNHRLLKNAPLKSRENLELALEPFFRIKSFPLSAESGDDEHIRLINEVREYGLNRPAFGLYVRQLGRFFVLAARLGCLESPILASWPPPLRTIDTVILTELILREGLNMTEEELDDATRISYEPDAHSALFRVEAEDADLAVIHNPPHIDQVQEVADWGLTMPRKSTNFFPKVITGLVFNPVNPYEKVDTA